MTFARKSSSALVLFIFSNVLELTGYDANLDVQPVPAQNGIKYVMAFSCIIFMLFGFVMAKRYVLTRAENAKVEKYLAIRRAGGLDSLSESERAEYDALTDLIS